MNDGSLMANVVILLIALSVAGVVGFTVVDEATSKEAQAFYDQSEQWCQDRGGELYNARVIGNHGGLHCDLPNGSHVHMDKVVEVNANTLENQTQ